MMGQGKDRIEKAKKDLWSILPIIIIIVFMQLGEAKKRRRLRLEEAGAKDLLK